MSCNVGPGIERERVHEIRRIVLDSIQQAVTEGWFSVIAAERLIRVEQQAPLVFARVILAIFVLHAFDVIAGRRRQTKFCADEIFKNRAVVAADGAMRFIADNELKIRGRKLG